MNAKKIILLGAGDFAREIMYAGLEQGGNVPPLEPVAFIDKGADSRGSRLEGVRIISLGEVSEVLDKDTYFIAAVGSPSLRKAVVGELLDVVPDAKFATIIHRSAVVMPNSVISDGVYIGPHATIAIGCCIKSHAVINFNVSVGHDCVIGEYSVINPGCILSGRTRVGSRSLLGSGAITYPKVTIGDECAVSAGATVARNLSDARKVILKPDSMIIPSNGGS